MEDRDNLPYRKFKVIIHNSLYFLTEIRVYKDGVIDCWMLVDFEEFKHKLDIGWVTLEIPDNETLHIQNLGKIEIKSFVPEKSNEDFIKEVEDCIIELNGGQGRVQKCKEAFKNYLVDDSEENFARLKAMFDDLPSNQKALFEHGSKDELVKLMNTEKPFSEEYRRTLLVDYFEQEYDEIELK
jgi:hypothetical protein